MRKQDYLMAGEEFNIKVLTLGAFANSMISASEMVKEKEEFPYKKDGEALMKKCRDLFKKGQAHMNSMFKGDNKTSYSELQFDHHIPLYNGRLILSKDYKENISTMNAVCLEMKEITRTMAPTMIHFDSGAKWTPTAADTKRQNSMLKTVTEVEKMLS